MLSGTCTLLASSGVSLFDPTLAEFLKNAGIATLFFVINLLVYEFLVIIAAAIFVAPFVMIKKVPERIADNAMYFAMRASMVVLFILMVLWVCNVYRLIPIP
ncbi:MAG: hypothetical protein MJ154_00720 [Candidatus Saccharibacteria bacterium]|nr:hypothetical protein [Candidatus Saccharibacteria bacterium]